MRTCPVCAIFIALSDSNNLWAVICNYARGISYRLKLTTDVIWQYANVEIAFKHLFSCSMQMQWLETSAFFPDMKKLNAYTECQAIDL